MSETEKGGSLKSIALNDEKIEKALDFMRQSSCTQLMIMSAIVGNGYGVYGYELYDVINNSLNEYGGTARKLHRSHLYCILSRLEKAGFISKRDKMCGSKLSRKYYYPTPLGREAFGRYTNLFYALRSWITGLNIENGGFHE